MFAVLAVRHVAGTRKPAVPRILGSFQGLQDQQRAAGIVFYDTASALFGVEGLRVTDAEAGPGGVVEVWAVTDYGGAAACPDCGTGVVAGARGGRDVPGGRAQGRRPGGPELGEAAAEVR